MNAVVISQRARVVYLVLGVIGSSLLHSFGALTLDQAGYTAVAVFLATILLVVVESVHEDRKEVAES